MSYKKVLTCTSAGTIAIQSKQVYGQWEFDLYKINGNYTHCNFIAASVTYRSNGYEMQLRDDTESITVNRVSGGSHSATLFQTGADYFANNTWYRLKVARLKSAGVFKDIPTLQVSAMENGTGANAYTSFTGYGRYGFSATSNGADTHVCGTADEISITNTYKYLVEFDAKLNSGTGASYGFRTSLTGTVLSNNVTLINGRNSAILTVTGTDTALLRFFNSSTATNYTISGLTIRRIYDANAFAVFIKGGAFTPDIDTGWTLVSTAGGSGINPVVDATYTTSNYLVLDLDAADRFSNLQITDGVEQ